jgi:hypothetical protein
MKKDTSFRSAISIKGKVEISLVWLGSRIGLQIISDLYGIAKCTIFQIVKESCILV